jgi:hypothetical protein
MQIRWLFATVLAVALAGCQTSSQVQQSATGAYLPMQGATVVVEREIVVPAGQARVYLQAGKGIVGGGFDSYKPHCAFEIASIDHGGYPIPVGRYTVTRVQRTIVPVVSIAPLQVAWSGGFVGGGSQSYYDGYHFWLADDIDPQVRRMTCFGVYAQPYELYPPTLEEVNAALGDTAELVY